MGLNEVGRKQRDLRMGMRDSAAGVDQWVEDPGRVREWRSWGTEGVSSKVGRWHSPSTESRIWGMTGLQWLAMTRPRVWPRQRGAVVACASNYVSPSLFSFSKRRAQLTSNDWAVWLRCSVALYIWLAYPSKKSPLSGSCFQIIDEKTKQNTHKYFLSGRGISFLPNVQS